MVSGALFCPFPILAMDPFLSPTPPMGTLFSLADLFLFFVSSLNPQPQSGIVRLDTQVLRIPDLTLTYKTTLRVIRRIWGRGKGLGCGIKG